MTDRPILYSAPMVRALIREVEEPGTGKTNTRRLGWRMVKKRRQVAPGFFDQCTVRVPTIWQKVRPGDRLWVREKHWCVEIAGGGVGAPYLVFDEEWSSGPGAREPAPAEERLWLGPPYFDDEDQEIRWGARPSIHMPRWASRLTLVVTETKMERLQEISEADAQREGMEQPIFPHWPSRPFTSTFRGTWNDLHGRGAWDDNPEVVALAFTVHKANIDQMEAAA